MSTIRDWYGDVEVTAKYRLRLSFAQVPFDMTKTELKRQILDALNDKETDIEFVDCMEEERLSVTKVHSIDGSMSDPEADE